MEFEWDETKAAANFKKHKASFLEASTVFSDPLSVTFRDRSIRWAKIDTSQLDVRNWGEYSSYRTRTEAIAFESSVLELPIAAKEKHMKKKVEKTAVDELRADYEPSLIRSGVRGKYAESYKAGVKLVMLAPDVAAAFPDAKSVNDALRLLLQIAKTTLPTSA